MPRSACVDTSVAPIILGITHEVDEFAGGSTREDLRRQARILRVDDEPAIVETVRAYLEDEGDAVEMAFDGPLSVLTA